MKWWRSTLLILVFFAAGATCFFVGARFVTPQPSAGTNDVPSVPAQEATTTLNILGVLPELEYADTPALRAQGLSGRASLSESAGLLFIFEESGMHGFWMKDMRFAIDMIWLNEAGTVVGLKEGVTPASYPEIFYPEHPARYVLETNIGFIARHNLTLGDTVMLPTR